MTIQANELQVLGIKISAWIYAPILFLLWLIVFYTFKGLLFRKLRNWSEKTTTKWDDFLVSSLDLPLNIVILSGGLAFLEWLLPLLADIDRAALLAVKILTIVAVFFFLDRLIAESLRLFSARVSTVDLSRGLIQGMVRLVVLSLGFLVVLDTAGISITPFIASLGIGSLAIALGLQETLANLFAGFFILADQPIRVGDFIRLETGEEGYVTDIGWRNTRIRMLPNIVVVVPNNKIISSTIHNYYLPDKEIAVLVQAGVHYSSDLAKVERVTVEVGREVQKKVQGAVPEFEPFIRYHTFGDSSIDFTVILRVKEFVDQYLLKHEFIKALHERYQKEGIVIPFPIRTLDISPQILKGLSTASRHSGEGQSHVE